MKDKENKAVAKYAVLFLLAVSAAVTAYYHLLLNPLLEKRNATNSSIATVQKQLKQRQRLLARSSAIEAEYKRMHLELTDLLQKQLPPQENAMAWSSEMVRKAGSVANLPENDWALKEYRSNASRAEKATQDSDLRPLFEDYEIDVNLRSQFYQFGKFTANLEKALPFIHIDSFSIHPDMSNPGTLQISVRCAFPRLRIQAFPDNRHPLGEKLDVGENHAVISHVERDRHQ